MTSQHYDPSGASTHSASKEEKKKGLLGKMENARRIMFRHLHRLKRLLTKLLHPSASEKERERERESKAGIAVTTGDDIFSDHRADQSACLLNCFILQRASERERDRQTERERGRLVLWLLQTMTFSQITESETACL